MKTLSAAAFRRLSFERKCDVVTFNGRFMMMRRQGECLMFLYSAHGFFVEVCFSTTYQKVLIINAIGDMKMLDSYLQEISITDLFPMNELKPKKKRGKKRKPGDWDDLLNNN